MLVGITENAIGGVISASVMLLVLYLIAQIRPRAVRHLSASWRRHSPVVADTIFVWWRRVLVALALMWGAAAVAAYVLTGGTETAVHTWATTSLYIVASAVWAYAIYLGMQGVRHVARLGLSLVAYPRIRCVRSR